MFAPGIAASKSTYCSILTCEGWGPNRAGSSDGDGRRRLDGGKGRQDSVEEVTGLRVELRAQCGHNGTLGTRGWSRLGAHPERVCGWGKAGVPHCWIEWDDKKITTGADRPRHAEVLAEGFERADEPFGTNECS